MKNITIIGGSGFIGSVLIKVIAADYEIKNIDKKKSRIIDTAICDVRDKSKLETSIQQTDAVILLAAEHKDNVSPASLYYDVNVEGARNVLNVVRKKNIQSVFFTSTVAVYGLNKENPDESHSIDPFNDYGKSKYQAEELLREWYQEDSKNRNLIIVRPTVVFGVENRGNVYNLLQQILKGSFKMVGNGMNKKSMSYVENIAAFFKYLMDHNYKGYHLFNYVDKPDLTTKELIKTISRSCNRPLDSFSIPYPIGFLAGICFDILAKVTGKEQQISSVRIKKFCSTTQFSDKRVKEETNFMAPYSLEEGLDKTIKSLL